MKSSPLTTMQAMPAQTGGDLESVQGGSELSEEVEGFFETSEDVREVEAEGLDAALDSAAGDFSVDSFKCLCGLSHGHSTDKHVATEGGEGVDMDSVEDMEMNPVCHCGAHEVAEKAGEFDVDEAHWEGVARSAPVPQSVKRQLGRA